jgi:glucoamylase
VRRYLYDGKIPTETVIKADLEYVAHHWNETSFDLWEEVKGMHFYTLMVQRRALVEGAQFADVMGDGGAAQFYRNQAASIGQAIKRFWNNQKGTFVVTLNRDGGIDYKSSGIDSAIILGVIHGYAGDGFLSPANDLVQSSALVIKSAFDRIYPINQNKTVESAIGRYPEDRYTGYSSSGEGNPWVLTTNAYAELYYRMRHEYANSRSIRVTQFNKAFLEYILDGTALQANTVLTPQNQLFGRVMRNLGIKGDAFMARTFLHGHQDGALSEQINRHSGYMQGAPNLTWSHASILTAALFRSAR